MKRKKNCRHCVTWLFGLTLLAGAAAYSQTPPDAGAVRQELERAREPVEPKKSAPTVESDTSARPGTAAVTGTTVTVASFRFTGNTRFNDKQLNESLAGFVRRPLSFADLQKAVSTVTEIYRRAGWTVRAYLPLQEINDGVVTIAIVEAIYGETRLEGDAPKRIPFERLSAIVSTQQKKGAPLNAAELDRALLLINELPGIKATGHLAAGKLERETDLILQVKDDPLVTGEAAIDNEGSRSTGEVREIGTAFLNSLFHRGDQTSLTYLHADGINYEQLTETIPIGNNGWRAGAHASHLNYKVVAPEFAALDAKGSSTAFKLDADYALVRARTKSASLSFALDDGKFDNESNHQTVTRYKVSSASAEVNGYRFDDFGHGGVNSGALTLVYGKADLSDSPNRLADAQTTHVDGGFGKLHVFASRNQHLTERTSLYAAATGQFASGNLDSSEKFYLGGASGVRAYPANEGGGDDGLLVTVEGRVRLPLNVNVAAFYDWGQITINHENNFPGAATLNNYSLQGAGTSISWVSSFGLSLKATWAHRVGSNPHPTLAGTDQDGSLKKNRFWLQASMSF